MTTRTTFSALQLALTLALIASAFYLYLPPNTQLEGSTIYQGPYLQTATTSTSVSVTVSTRILATTTNPIYPDGSFNRIYATICNPNANPVYINMDGDKSAGIANVTAIIAAAAGYNACFEINDRNPYNGSVTASSTNQTATVISVKEYVD